MDLPIVFRDIPPDPVDCARPPEEHTTELCCEDRMVYGVPPPRAQLNNSPHGQYSPYSRTGQAVLIKYGHLLVISQFPSNARKLLIFLKILFAL